MLPKLSATTIAVLLLSAASCQPHKRNPDPQAAEQAKVAPPAQAAAEAPPPPAPAPPPEPHLEVPAAPPPPSGIDAGFWSYVHWLPEEIVGISGAATPRQLPIVSWLVKSSEVSGPECETVLGGLEAAYMVEWDAPPMSFVLVGDFTRKEAEACGAKVAATVGAELVSEAVSTTLRLGDKESEVAWMRLAGKTVILQADSTKRLGRLVDSLPGRLGGNEALIELLRHVDRHAEVWMSTRRDFGSKTLGQASTGLNLALGMPKESDVNLRIQGELFFDDEKTARAAHAGTKGYLKTLEDALGTKLETSSRLSDHALSFNAVIPGAAAVDVERLKGLATAIHQRADALEAERSLE